MACITTIYGEGGNCTNGNGLGNFGTYTFAGYWVPVSHRTCGWTWTSLAKDGVLHPNANFYSFKTSTFSYSGCGPDSASAYDCINGGCVPKATYNTPGVFASLAACQSGCAKNSNCTGECVPAEEIAALQQAANNIRAKFCG
jgi:hypothetical protein